MSRTARKPPRLHLQHLPVAGFGVPDLRWRTAQGGPPAPATHRGATHFADAPDHCDFADHMTARPIGGPTP